MTYAADLPTVAGSNFSHSQDVKETVLDPQKRATGVYVTVHGHFYQPPRENPYLDAVERQPSAAPFHDWNERIHHECYRPNAFARVLNEQGEVVGIVNNYEYLSFNIGATLMSWLERYDLEVYQRILEADRKSCDRLNGHGNAIAQVYNHTIMPLANERDKYTQIRWGIADFRSRFGRNPEGMWLAETAVDYATIDALVQEGIRFIILAPSQAERCRPFPTDEEPATEWHEVGGSQIDPTRPYRCFLKGVRSEERGVRESSFPVSSGELGGGSPYIDIFFYDGPISRDMGFSDTLNNCHHFIGRIGGAVRGDHRASQLISVATDGETFGHHKAGTEKTLAYAFLAEFPHQGWQVTNFAHYLSLHPPTWEVELKPVTAWSCAHGVDRWQDDCGCGGGGGWHQKWRRPLRDSLDWLRDRLIDVYSYAGKQLLRDPWLARDEYIQVIRDRSPENVTHFLSRHQTHKLTAAQQVDALRLLEMQRHALLMYTSCGWFFEELSRPEGTQILRYAARAMELAGDVAGVQLDKEFVHRLTLAPSNVDLFKHGGEVYRQLVLTAGVSIKQVAAQYAITSLFRKGLRSQEPEVRSQNDESPLINYQLPIPNSQSPHSSLLTPHSSQHIYCYTAHQLDYQLQRIGTLTLAVGQLKLVSEITWESEHLIFAVLHLGGWDFHCCIQPFTGRRTYSQIKEKLFEALQQASAAHAIKVMMQMFGDQSFSLHELLPEERHRIMQLLSQETLTRLDQLYTQVYRDNYGVLMAFHRDRLPVPQELQVAAQIALSHRCLHLVRSLCEEIGEPQLFWDHLTQLETLALEAKHLHCQLNIPQGKQTLEQLIERSLWQLLHNTNHTTVEADLQRLERLIDVAYQLNLGLSIDRVQEIYFGYLHSQIVPWCVHQQNQAQPDYHQNSNQPIWDTNQLRHLLKLGQKLGVDASFWLNQLN